MLKIRKPSKEKTDEAIIPKLNSALFSADNYNYDNSILLYNDKIIKYAVGWCYTDELPIKYNTTFLKEIAIMYDVPEDEIMIDNGRYWSHISLDSFIVIFCPDFFKGE